jgi:branched-subunit amino acid aminotransferase/4-amino-4-deoxychorismate lyase
MMARQEAAHKGAEESLWFTADRQLAEGCTSNVFLVLDGRVCTPPRDTPVLPGIVREAVLELCASLGVPADADTPLSVREMLAAREMFMTSSVAGIRPVVSVERHEVGDGQPGPITRKLMAAYAELVERECGQ